MLEFLRTLLLNQEAQHTQGNQGNQGTQEDQDAQGVQQDQGNQHFKTGNQCWFKRSCAQFKSPARMSPYQGVTKCQNNPRYSRQVDVLPVTVAKLCQNAPSSSAPLQRQKVKQSAVSMEGHLMGPRQFRA
jgi:hypothetical protein